MLLVLAASPVSAAGTAVTLSPTTVSPGDAITITITDLPDGSDFALEITSDDLISSGAEWYNLTNFQMPFSLKCGELCVVGGNVNSIFFEAKKGGVTQSVTKEGAGSVTISETRDINQGTYEYIRIRGAVADPDAPASVDLSFSGEKHGDNDSEFEFAIEGASSGTVEVAVTVDCTELLCETITIVAPTPTPTPSGPSGPSAPSSPRSPGAAAPMPVETPMPFTREGTLQTGSDGSVMRPIRVTSSDGVAALTIGRGVKARTWTGSPLSSVTIDPVRPADLPGVPAGAAFAFAGYAYDCRPNGATFDPAITLAFTLTEEQWEGLDLAEGQTLAVMWFNGATGLWEELPTAVSARTRTVTAQVTHFSTFGLMSAEEAPAAAPTPTPTRPAAKAAAPEEPEEGLPVLPIVFVLAVVVLAVAAGLFFLKETETNEEPQDETQEEP